MSSASTVKRIAYFVFSYISLGIGTGFASFLVHPLLRFTAPFLPDEPHSFYWLSIIPICVLLLCAFYLFATHRKGIFDFTNIKQLDFKRLLLLFFSGFAVVFISLSLVLLLSWLSFASEYG